MKKRYTLYAIVSDKNGYTLASRTNSYTKTHPLQKLFAEKVKLPKKIYLHAEVHALIVASFFGKPYKLTVITSHYTASKPCPICVYAARFFGVKYIEYYDNQGNKHGKTTEALCAEYGI